MSPDGHVVRQYQFTTLVQAVAFIMDMKPLWYTLSTQAMNNRVFAKVTRENKPTWVIQNGPNDTIESPIESIIDPRD
jgi:hypothetical protein